MFRLATIFLSLALSYGATAQDGILENVGAAMKAGSSKELIKFCNSNLEIKLNGKASNYSIIQAEVVLRDFFLKNPSRGFEYVHRGSATAGSLKYSIGTYKFDEGSYRVLMLLKKVNDEMKIDSISLSRE
ncbi:MAG: DUF4783 domain-containing protein [Cyclobacteriaceae bacterium]